MREPDFCVGDLEVFVTAELCRSSAYPEAHPGGGDRTQTQIQGSLASSLICSS
jgi:hypothetical protein